MKKIVAIIGSASLNSSSHKLVRFIESLNNGIFDITVYDQLRFLPHFDPALTADAPPVEVQTLRNLVEKAEGILICTPEYIFSIPSGLKNALEWFVSTTLFSGKPTAILTASLHGEKAHTELQLIMKTLMARFTPETTLLIQGIKGKTGHGNSVTDEKTINELIKFVESFNFLLNHS